MNGISLITEKESDNPDANKNDGNISFDQEKLDEISRSSSSKADRTYAAVVNLTTEDYQSTSAINDQGLHKDMSYQEKNRSTPSKTVTEIREKVEIGENEVTVGDSKETEEPNDKMLWVRDGSPNETGEFIYGKIEFIKEKLEMYKSRNEKVPYTIDLGDGYQWSYGNIIQKKAQAGKKPYTEILEIPITENKEVLKELLKQYEEHIKFKKKEDRSNIRKKRGCVRL